MHIERERAIDLQNDHSSISQIIMNVECIIFRKKHHKNVKHHNFHSQHPFIEILVQQSTLVQRSMQTHVNCLDCIHTKKYMEKERFEILSFFDFEMHTHWKLPWMPSSSWWISVRVCVFKRQTQCCNISRESDVQCTMYSRIERYRTIECYVDILSTEHWTHSSEIQRHYNVLNAKSFRSEPFNI